MKNYELIENVLYDMTPQPESFKDSVYPAEEVQADEEALQHLREAPNYKEQDERADAKILEKIFTEFAEQDDWFGEEMLYADDPDWRAFSSVPASEIDDNFRHFDTIGTVANRITDYNVVPFAIDLTYNTDPEKIHKKFNWKHVYGKSELAPVGVSEFGQVQQTKGAHGQDYRQLKRLPLRQQAGLKIPGFASAKYYEDTNSMWDPALPKGRIKVMPRFVVGFNPELADILAQGEPDKYETIMKYGQETYDRRNQEYYFAKESAKWCTLFELSQQASEIEGYIESLSDTETTNMDSEELALASKQISALEKYFSNALAEARASAKKDPLERKAMEYAKKDPVCQTICSQSFQTYSLDSLSQVG